MMPPLVYCHPLLSSVNMENEIPSIHNNIILCFSINVLSKLMLFYFNIMFDNNDDDVACVASVSSRVIA